jgi:chitin synthase
MFKFLTSLQLSAKQLPEYHDKFMLLIVPCYTEGDASLYETIDSLSTMDYDENCKLIFIVANGMIMYSNNKHPMPKIML